MSTVVITGANRGIGLEITKLLVKRGANVIALCRQSSPELSGLDVRIEEGIDVTSDDVVNVLPRLLADIQIDLLINNAGLLEINSLQDLGLDSIRRQFEVNALGPLKVMAALKGQMKSPSKAVFITSRMGSISDNTSGGMYGYRASKTALNMFATSVAQDLALSGVAVGILHPGFVQTDMTRGNGNVGPEEAAKDLVARMDDLTMETSGQFLHASGEVLPW